MPPIRASSTRFCASPPARTSAHSCANRRPEIVTPVVERAHRDGELRTDFDAQDLLIALRMVAVLAVSSSIARETTQRHVDVVLCGLRPD